MKEPNLDDLHRPQPSPFPTSRRGWLILLLWLAAIAFCLQFALASAAELETQAAFLGWILVLILLVGGLGVWGASLQDGRHRRD